MIQLVLIGFTALVLYAASLRRWPFRPCLRCAGTGLNKGSNRKRWGPCRRCAGTKQVRRLGATAVHRFWWSVFGAASKQRRKEKADQAREKAGYPEL